MSRSNRSARGGRLEDVFQEGTDSETKRFLGAGSERVWSAGVFWNADPFDFFKAAASFGYASSAGRGSLELAASVTAWY
jgi:hypothetical protein